MKHLPACGEKWPVLMGTVGPTHGLVHRCVLDVRHAGTHVCACGYRDAPITAVMESDQ